MKQFIFLFLVIVAGVSISPARADSQLFVSETVAVSFQPRSVNLLAYLPDVGLRRYPALIRQVSSLDVYSNSREYVVAGALPSSLQGAVTYAFSLSGADDQFHATAFRRRDVEELRGGTQNPEELWQAIRALRAKHQERQAASEEEEVTELKNEVAKMLSIDQLIQDTMTLRKKQFMVREKRQELERLRPLVESSRNFSRSGPLLSLQYNLTKDLKDIARATASVERLAQKNSRAAERELENKIKLIKETEFLDPKELAREVLRLRKRRIHLEEQRGVRENDFEREF